MASAEFVSFFNCRPEKWGPARYGVSGPRLGWTHRWRHGRRWKFCAAGYSKRRPMRMVKRYQDTRSERRYRRWQAALHAFGERVRAETTADRADETGAGIDGAEG